MQACAGVPRRTLLRPCQRRDAEVEESPRRLLPRAGGVQHQASGGGACPAVHSRGLQGADEELSHQHEQVGSEGAEGGLGGDRAKDRLEVEEVAESFEENECIKVVEGCRIPLPENHGNMCFATTTVHCLLQLKPFCDVIMANATNYEKWTGEEGERGRELCNLVLEAQKSPQKFLTNIIEQCGMELGRQEDAEEFLQLLLQNTTGEEFETAREVKMTCTECQTVTTQTQIDSILSVELRVNESDNLQSELGRMKNGITNHRCTSRKCSRRNKKGQTTIHQVICCNSFSVL